MSVQPRALLRNRVAVFMACRGSGCCVVATWALLGNGVAAVERMEREVEAGGGAGGGGGLPGTVLRAGWLRDPGREHRVRRALGTVLRAGWLRAPREEASREAGGWGPFCGLKSVVPVGTE